MSLFCLCFVLSLSSFVDFTNFASSHKTFQHSLSLATQEFPREISFRQPGASEGEGYSKDAIGIGNFLMANFENPDARKAISGKAIF